MHLRMETGKKHWMIKMEENRQNEDHKRRNERKRERKITNEFKEGIRKKKHWMIKMKKQTKWRPKKKKKKWKKEWKKNKEWI